jgi:hypothetical protein
MTQRKAQLLLGVSTSIFSKSAVCNGRRGGAQVIKRELCGVALIYNNSFTQKRQEISELSQKAQKRCPSHSATNSDAFLRIASDACKSYNKDGSLEELLVDFGRLRFPGPCERRQLENGGAI